VESVAVEIDGILVISLACFKHKSIFASTYSKYRCWQRSES
jgi:hypothetical protein